MHNWKKLIAVTMLFSSLTLGNVLTAFASETGVEAQEAVKVENSWRYDNGILVEQEESNEGIMTADTLYVTTQGIDVSEHNKEIDWEKVKESGVDYVILRCGYGSDEEKQDDQFWENNVAECERLEIPYGVYLYSYAKNLEEAKSEAEHVLRLIEGKKLDYPVYLDMEDRSTLEADHAAIATVFCEAIEEAGYKAGVYANTDWWNRFLTDPVFDNWERWVAQYNYTCDYVGTYQMWQYTSKGKIDGITGNVDMNYRIESLASGEEHVKPLTFEDVSETDWFYPFVSYVAGEKIMTGVGENKFAPTQTLVRAEVATILYRLAGKPKVSYETRFPDVPDEQFYTDAVMWASLDSVGIATGYTDSGCFKPGNSITREEFVTMLYRYAKYKGMNVSNRADLSSFPDAGLVNAFAREPMQWAVAEGLITGDQGRINPQGKTIRAECATIIKRFMEVEEALKL